MPNVMYHFVNFVIVLSSPALSSSRGFTFWVFYVNLVFIFVVALSLWVCFLLPSRTRSWSVVDFAAIIEIMFEVTVIAHQLALVFVVISQLVRYLVKHARCITTCLKKCNVFESISHLNFCEDSEWNLSRYEYIKLKVWSRNRLWDLYVKCPVRTKWVSNKILSSTYRTRIFHLSRRIYVSWLTAT